MAAHGSLWDAAQGESDASAVPMTNSGTIRLHGCISADGMIQPSAIAMMDGECLFALCSSKDKKSWKGKGCPLWLTRVGSGPMGWPHCKRQKVSEDIQNEFAVGGLAIRPGGGLVVVEGDAGKVNLYE